MARDLAEQERAFVHSLNDDTGRDLAGWMTAIAASGHTRRNDIIDWLRHRGFTFANASWLERIHHNGGQLIYGQDHRGEAPDLAAAYAAPAGPDDAAAVTPASAAHKTGSAAAAPAPAHSIPAPVTRQAPPPASLADDRDVTTLLLAAKGLRPLAELILREMAALVPTLVRAADPPFVTIASPMPFAALLPAPKELRLFADFGPGSRDRTRKAEASRVAAVFPDVLVLSDARQIDDRFRELVAAAYTRALS